MMFSLGSTAHLLLGETMSSSGKTNPKKINPFYLFIFTAVYVAIDPFYQEQGLVLSSANLVNHVMHLCGHAGLLFHIGLYTIDGSF